MTFEQGKNEMPCEFVSYQHDQTELEAYLAFTDHSSSPRPLILVAPDWRGRSEFACEKANELAKLGYVGFALDMYGKGIIGKSVEENKALMTPFMEDRNFLLQRMLAGLTAAKQHPAVDARRVAAIGFCFGGLCVLDLARSGADIRGVVSFHGLLTAPENNSKTQIKAKILALHGYNDPMVPLQHVETFANEMQKKEVDWQIHMYGNTQHAFTNPLANDPKLGTLYNPVAAQRSWQAMKNFLEEIF